MAASMRSPGAMAPPPPRQPTRPTTVLDEDEWTLYLEEIIERDFFPDLARLKNRLDWLQASRSGDPEAIREAQMRIQERQLGRTPAGGSVSTPSFGTPSASGHSTPARGGGGARAAFPDEGYRAQLASALAAAAAEHDQVAPSDMRLDDFMARFTSEDNASFADIMERVNARRRQRALPAWSAERQERAVDHQLRLLSADDAAPAERRLVVAPARADSIEDDAHPAMTGLRMHVEQERNALFFYPDGVPPSASDAPVTRGSVDPRGTRFDATTGASNAEDGGGEPGLSRLQLHQQRHHTYSVVATPAVTPGASPIMTWGRVDATPMRLDAAEEEPMTMTGVPLFRMAPPARREAVGAALAHAAGASLRRSGAAGAGGMTPGRPAVAASPLLSNAARRVLQRAAAAGRTPVHGGSDVDLALRRSYSTPRGTPAPTPGPSAAPTPRATPRPHDDPVAKRTRVE